MPINVAEGVVQVSVRGAPNSTPGVSPVPHVTTIAPANFTAAVHAPSRHSPSPDTAQSVTSYVPAIDGAGTRNRAVGSDSHCHDAARQPQLQ